jgi:non-specific serine/threonine protein kinase
MSTRLALVLTPYARLHLVADDDAPVLDDAIAASLREAFARGTGAGLLQLGGEPRPTLPPLLAWWRDFAMRYVAALRTAAAGAGDPVAAIAPPDDETLAPFLLGAPVMRGAEYVDRAMLHRLWRATDEAVSERLGRRTRGAVAALLRELHPAWGAVGRVHFNLAEHRADLASPFAFVATWTHGLTPGGEPRHVVLGDALREYAGAAGREALVALLLPVQRAAEALPWLQALVESGALFWPLRWSADDAFRLMRDLPTLERAGIVVRMPAGWQGRRAPRPQVSATVGTAPAAGLGGDALLDFRVDVTLDGAPLTTEEREALLAARDGLVLLRGTWVEVNGAQLQATLAQWREAERRATTEGLSFAEAMRLMAGIGDARDGTTDADDEDDLALVGSEPPSWSRVVPGPWLAALLADLRAPQRMTPIAPGRALHATLRPYQVHGVRWLDRLVQLGLGACLADDMGLGKTIQLLALLLVRKRARRGAGRPTLVVAPASLLANWQAEAARVAPSLRVLVAHGSAMPASEVAAIDEARLQDVDVVITTYGALRRLAWPATIRWDLVVFDEAQALRNAGTRQARAARTLNAHARVALTGTPIENRLSDLWALFDVINPGLLGSARQFAAYTKRLDARAHDPYGPLRALVRPYLLRRRKDDPEIVADLPPKTELIAWCALSRVQAALYQQAVDELRTRLADADGMRRRGVVLAFLVRFKQLCNHPSQWLRDGAWAPGESGKLERLRELGEEIAARQEKLLVFTQFREATRPLADFCATVFGTEGLVLHGGTPVAKRAGLVERFAAEDGPPFFVISLKAGGTGLNLPAASHVIHFDRWWNPAVEDQATDRAHRIGQQRHVLVHKFVCRGTVEERIDALIRAKRQLSTELLQGDGTGEIDLTSLDDEALLDLVALDLPAALAE